MNNIFKVLAGLLVLILALWGVRFYAAGDNRVIAKVVEKDYKLVVDSVWEDKDEYEHYVYHGYTKEESDELLNGVTFSTFWAAKKYISKGDSVLKDAGSEEFTIIKHPTDSLLNFKQMSILGLIKK